MTDKAISELEKKLAKLSETIDNLPICTTNDLENLIHKNEKLVKMEKAMEKLPVKNQEDLDKIISSIGKNDTKLKTFEDKLNKFGSDFDEVKQMKIEEKDANKKNRLSSATFIKDMETKAGAIDKQIKELQKYTKYCILDTQFNELKAKVSSLETSLTEKEETIKKITESGDKTVLDKAGQDLEALKKTFTEKVEQVEIVQKQNITNTTNEISDKLDQTSNLLKQNVETTTKTLTGKMDEMTDTLNKTITSKIEALDTATKQNITTTSNTLLEKITGLESIIKSHETSIKQLETSIKAIEDEKKSAIMSDACAVDILRNNVQEMVSDILLLKKGMRTVKDALNIC